MCADPITTPHELDSRDNEDEGCAVSKSSDWDNRPEDCRGDVWMGADRFQKRSDRESYNENAGDVGRYQQRTLKGRLEPHSPSDALAQFSRRVFS
jgi:hypothetical protein